MRRSLVVVIAFLAGLGIGYFAHRAHAGSFLRRDTHAADFAGIEKLRQQDIDVTLPQDPKGLIDIFTDDAVRFNPGNPTAVGKQAIAAENEKFRAQYPGFKVLSYAPKFKDLQIEDGLAWEWSEADASFKISAEAPPTSFRFTGLRVMKRQSDGSWKFVVLIPTQ
jgi:ketosteroid isomerase-like protein